MGNTDQCNKTGKKQSLGKIITIFRCTILYLESPRETILKLVKIIRGFCQIIWGSGEQDKIFIM